MVSIGLERIESPVAASYSYECKECTKKRVKKSNNTWEYPDW